jgi:hypothetical protein
MTYGVQDLERALDRVPPKSQSFAADLVRKAKKYGPSAKQLYWIDKLTQEALNPTPPPVRQTVAVGDMAGIIALFDRAKVNLKFPAITLSCPGAEALRINIAGPSAKFPGSLNVTSSERGEDGRRRWFGRVYRNGRWEPSAKAEQVLGVVAARLREFAFDPVRIAAEHGKLNAICCFCNKKLGARDASVKPSATALKSLAVGYGKDCAEHYGLPWGEV